MDLESHSYHHRIHDYEADRQSKLRALILLASGVLIFGLSVVGIFDSLSEAVAESLVKNLGYTNKWSVSFGPEWFIGINRDISALAGFPLLLIFLTVIIIYYNLRNETRRLWRLLFIIIGGGFLMLTAKIIFSHNIPDDPLIIFTNSISQFPSGHAMMGTIFYISMAVTISRRQHSVKTIRLTLFTGIVLVMLIGVSRILPGLHSVSDVIAGWSLGLIWLCVCWILERRIKKKLRK